VALGHLHVDLVVEVLQQFQVVDDAEPLVEPHQRHHVDALQPRQIAALHPTFVIVFVFSF
jgi:hypothetical protein